MMPNAIKYSTSAQTLAVKKGNFWIGTGDVGKGPTSSTDYYNGITPPSGGYTIYLNKASNGPAIYTVSNDSDLIKLTNQIANASYTTTADCYNYFVTQTDKMIMNKDFPTIITSGLCVFYDFSQLSSYPASGITWYNLGTTPSPNVTLYNGPIFNSGSGGYMTFDGADDYGYVTDGGYRFGIPATGMSSTFVATIRPNDASASVTGTDIVLWGCAYSNCYNGYELFKHPNISPQYGRVISCYAFGTSGIVDNGVFAFFPLGNNNFHVIQATFKSNGDWYITVDGQIPTCNRIDTNGGSYSNVPASGTVTNFLSWVQARPELGFSTGNYGNSKTDIGNFYVYNRDLSLAEHQQNYNAIKIRYT